MGLEFRVIIGYLSFVGRIFVVKFFIVGEVGFSEGFGEREKVFVV